MDTGTGLNLWEPREVADAPPLVVFKASVDKALSNLVRWEMSLHMAVRLGLDGL